MTDPASTGNGPRFDESETLPPPLDPLAAELVSVTPADARFDMIRLIARGGEGEIWEAEQVSLGRVVAIKVMRRQDAPLPHAESAAETRQRARGLCMEARLAAALEHPNIVPVHDLASNATGQPMFAMKRVFGTSWAADIADTWQGHDREAYLERHLGILADLAQAIAFAHSRGIVHRDIKPSQVMIGEFGEVLLMDWGLAVSMPPGESDDRWRARQNPVPPTIGFARNPGGTPAFMAPEQTSADILEVGPWTDVYLLGATLYYVLTGSPPHARGTSEESMSAAATNSFAPLAAAGAGELPDGLEDLVLDAMRAKGRERPTAMEFLERLGEIRSGHPRRRKSAAIVEEVERTLPQARSYGDYAALSGRLRDARVLWPANPALHPAEARVVAAHGEHALAERDLGLASLLADALPEGDARSSLRDRAARALARSRRREAQRRLAFAGLAVLLVAASVAALVAGAQKKRADAQLRETERAMERVRASEQAATSALAHAEREQYFAGVGIVDAHFRDSRPDLAFETLVERMPPALRQWEWGALLARLAVDDMTLTTGEVAAAGAAFHADWSRDGTRIATGHHGGRICLWDAETGNRTAEWKLDGFKGFWCVRFDAAGERIAASSTNGKAVVVDARDGRILAQVVMPPGKHQPVMRGCDFAPDGHSFATTGEDEYLRIWDAASGAPLRETKLPSSTYDVRYAPDGRTLAVAVLNEDKEAWIVDAATGEAIRPLAGHRRSVLSVRFDASGERVVTAGNDGSVRIFAAATGELLRDIAVPEARLRCAEFSADGRLVAASGNDAVCRVWDAATGDLAHRIAGAKQMEKIAFAPSGARLLTVSFDEIRLWDLDRMAPPQVVPTMASEPDAERLRLPSFPYARNDVWYNYDRFFLANAGRHVYARGDERYVVDSYYSTFDLADLWRLAIDFETGNARVFEGTGDVPASDVLARAYVGAFSPDGGLVALGTHAGDVILYGSGAWTERARWHWPGEGTLAVTALAFAPSGDRLVVGSQTGKLAILDPARGELLREIPAAHKAGKPTVALSWSADGERFVSASSDETAKVWDAATGELVSTMTGHGLNVLSAVFSPDGERVLTTAMDNKAKIWETATGREIMNVLVLPPEESMMGGAFSRDGRRAFFATAGGRLHVVEALPWSADDWNCPEGEGFLRCLELRKRRAHTGLDAKEADIAWR